MKPAKLDLRFTQGDDFSIRVTVETALGVAVSQVGNTFTAKIRPHPTSSVVWAATVDTSLLASGVVGLSWTDAQTTQMPLSAVWDLQRVVSTDPTLTLIAGSVTVDRDVSR